jgi:hypothetical protein
MINTDSITKELILEQYQDFENILLASYTQKNFDIYLNDLDDIMFLERLMEMDVDVKKEMALIRKVQKNKHVDMLFDTIQQMISLMEVKQLSLDSQAYLEGNLLTKVIIATIVAFTRRDIELFSGDDEIKMVSHILSSMSCNTNIITYLGLNHDKKWIDFRKRELALRIEQETETKEEYIQEVKEKPMNEKEFVEEKNLIEKKLTNAEKIINIIEELDSNNGASMDEVISKSKIVDAEKLIKNLMEEGEIFQIKPGKLKVM